MKKLFIDTLGCQMNKSDTERIVGMLSHFDYVRTEDELEAIDNGALETVDAGDPDELEHFDSEEDSVVVPIPEFEEETDEDTYY